MAYEEIRAELVGRREALERRVGAIQGDRRRRSGALDPDWAEQAIERENDEVLDALDVSSRTELDAVRAALVRMDRAEYGRCVDCGGEIAAARLQAMPTAALCRGCAG